MTHSFPVLFLSLMVALPSLAQKKLTEANTDLDTLVGTRTRVIQRKLKDIEEMPEENPNLLK